MCRVAPNVETRTARDRSKKKKMKNHGMSYTYPRATRARPIYYHNNLRVFWHVERGRGIRIAVTTVCVVEGVLVANETVSRLWTIDGTTYEYRTETAFVARPGRAGRIPWYASSTKDL